MISTFRIWLYGIVNRRSGRERARGARLLSLFCFWISGPRPVRELKQFRADAIGQLLLYAMAKDVPDNVRLRIHLFSVPNRGRRDREKLSAFIALCERLEIEVTCEPATECQA